LTALVRPEGFLRVQRQEVSMARQHSAPTPAAFLSPLVTVVLLLAAAAPGSEAATVRGQLRYLDRGGQVAIQRALVDIRFKGTGVFDVWRSVGTATTDRFGRFTHTDSIGSGTYSVAVFATNDAAVVWPVDVHFESFRVPVGETVTTMQSPTSPSSVLDFSFDFVTPGVTRFFSVASAWTMPTRGGRPAKPMSSPQSTSSRSPGR
jgi:hypothetical protein